MSPRDGISQDKSVLASSKIYNRYAYAANNPTTLVDPSGHQAQAMPLPAELLIPQLEAAIAATYLALTAQVMLVTQRLVNVALAMGRIAMVMPPGMGIFLVGFFVMLMVAVAELFHVIGIMLEIVQDPFGYFLDHVVPDKPPLILTNDQLLTASQGYPQGPDQCIQGAVEGVGEELAWSVLLGPAGPLDLMMAAYFGCMMSGSGGSGDQPPKLPKLDLNKLSQSLAKRLEKALQQEGSSIHQLKQDIVGDHGSQFDLYVDKKTGDIFLLRRGGIGEPQPTHLNINQLLN